MSSASMPGMFLGTAAYMAPEQAKGQEADHRADVWAFGCVLFEMLTGRAVFEGDTGGEILADVLKADPDWRRFPKGTPDAIRHLLRRCMEKDRRFRLHDMADVRIEVEETSSSPHIDRPTGPGVGRDGNGLSGFQWRFLRRSRRHGDVGMARGALECCARDARRNHHAADNRSDVAGDFAGRPERRLRGDVRGTAAAVAAAPATAEPRGHCPELISPHPFWSPDSRSIGYFADLRLKRLDIDGGTVQPLARIEVGFGGTWTRDGVIFFSSGPARPSFGSRDRRRGGAGHASEASQTGHRFPHILPDGRHLLYYVTGTPESWRCVCGRSRWVRGAPIVPRRFGCGLFAFRAPAVCPARHALCGGLQSRHVDHCWESILRCRACGLEQRPWSRSALRIDDRAHHLPPSSERDRQQFIWFDRKGREVGRLGEAGDTGPAHPSLSPDGDRVAMTRAQGGNPDVWLLDTRSRLSRFTLDPSTEIYPIWSPDGSRIVFGSNRRGRRGLELFQKSTTTSERDELLATSEGADNRHARRLVTRRTFHHLSRPG